MIAVRPLSPADQLALARRAKAAIDAGNEAELLAETAAAAAEVRTNPLLWQLTGLLHRGLDQHEAALAAFEQAVRLAPDDARIAHGRAHVALEAGVPSAALFDKALRLSPGEADVRLGHAAARFAAGQGTTAAAELDAELVRNPGWAGGHARLAHMRVMLGQRDTAMASFERALAAMPGEFPLWEALISTLIQGDLYAEARDAIRRARAAIGDGPWFDANEAVVLSELGEADAADALFAKVAHFPDMTLAVRRVRHLLRTDRLGEALALIDQSIGQPQAVLMWPYAAIAWRLAGDARYQWLEGDTRLVSVTDLADRLPPLDRLAEVLRGLHHARGQHLDQSVRGGTQTDGPLFCRIEPEIRQLRAAVVEAVRAHIAQLPPPDPRHPILGLRRDRPIRFSGSWSVRLAGAGHHASHIHPMGWFSSALYVALPDEAERGGGHAGWLTLGEPRDDLGLDLPPLRHIEPKPGRLVLFPSTMWHGTVPFAAGERLTVAFDVAPPR
jgi:tetratricopeptide (TPR) repeat protein